MVSTLDSQPSTGGATDATGVTREAPAVSPLSERDRTRATTRLPQPAPGRYLAAPDGDEVALVPLREPTTRLGRRHTADRVLEDAPVSRRHAPIVRDVREHCSREIAVARFLHAAGAPVVAPHEPAGPHERDGRVLTLWELVPAGPPPGGPALGAALRACHEALHGYRGELPPLRALLDEATVVARRALDGDDRRLVVDGLARVSEALPPGGQPLHGDAGVLNALPGPRWHDWEDACVGPVGWDLACLVTSPRVLGRERERAEAALIAAGGEPDPLLVEARALQLAAW